MKCDFEPDLEKEEVSGDSEGGFVTFLRRERGLDVPRTPESYILRRSPMLIGCLCVIVRPMPFKSLSCFSSRSFEVRNRSSVTMSKGTQYGFPEEKS